ncbi:hypothetical protein HMPREF1987_01060 [Peptostreptococcaceae bacterium oral taxon 113 str. W5053]|nr:hypothetical protein HMPREF1987_01060 [Peptostreptococcaceae bacterium oral taxon 113 str. W5053]
MAKNFKNKYWENEKSEIVEFGNSFLRTFDESGKLQFGKIIKNKETGEKTYFVKFVLDRKELFESEEGVDFLQGTLNMWAEEYVC